MSTELVWYVYLLRCTSTSHQKAFPSSAYGTLYCGIALDPQERLKAHNSGSGAKYTHGKFCKMVLSVGPFDKSTALRLEAATKKCSAEKKVEFLRYYENWLK